MNLTEAQYESWYTQLRVPNGEILSGLYGSGTIRETLPSLLRLSSAATIAFSVTLSTKAEASRLRSSSASGSATPLDSVPMLDLERQYQQVREEVLAAIERVCASQHYILGAEVEAFEHELAGFCGASEAVGCASGTDALWLALVAAGVQPGDQVLTTPFSFFASASAIVRAGARPVFADIDPQTFNLDPAQVGVVPAQRPHDKLRALLPVHLYGQCADMDEFQKLADEFRLILIEDAAQAIGARWGINQIRLAALDRWAFPPRSVFIPQKISAPTAMPGW